MNEKISNISETLESDRQTANDLVVILRDFLHGRPSQVTVTKELLLRAKQHEIEGIVFYQTKAPQLQEKYFYTAFAYQQRRRAAKELRQLLPHSFTVKGLHIAQFYPVPYLRTCGDIDIVVPLAEKERAAAILQENGYALSLRLENAEWHFEKNGLEYELHHDLLYDEVVNIRRYREYFNRCWEYVKDGELDWNFHFLYIFFHFRRHFMCQGVGFRHFLDLAVMTRNQAIDWTYIQRELDDLGLTPFAKTCYSLIETWFQIPSPIGTLELTEDFIAQATDKILHNGLFGFHDKTNQFAGMSNQIIQSKYSPAVLKFFVTLSTIFPSYRAMRGAPCYSFINHRPYLLPFAWVYRWCTKWKIGKQTLERIYISDDKVQERARYLQNWNAK